MPTVELWQSSIHSHLIAPTVKNQQFLFLSKLIHTNYLQSYIMGYPDTTEGFCVAGPKTWNKFSKQTLKLKPFGDDDIDVKIEACGVCGSDLHTITGGWGEYKGPMCVGHEIIGKAIKVGKNVKEIKEGDRVGVGAQVWSCLECKVCKSSNENYCPKLVGMSSQSRCSCNETGQLTLEI